MNVLNNGERIVKNIKTIGENSIPELGVSATASCSDIESFIEVAYFFEYLFPKRHVCARTNLPHRWASFKSSTEKIIVILFRDVPAVEGPEFFENNLGLSVQ